MYECVHSAGNEPFYLPFEYSKNLQTWNLTTKPPHEKLKEQLISAGKFPGCDGKSRGKIPKGIMGKLGFLGLTSAEHGQKGENWPIREYLKAGF